MDRPHQAATLLACFAMLAFSWALSQPVDGLLDPFAKAVTKPKPVEAIAA